MTAYKQEVYRVGRLVVEQREHCVKVTNLINFSTKYFLPTDFGAKDNSNFAGGYDK